MRLTLKAINEELARLGQKAEVVKGGGYFFFRGEDADEWIDRTVPVTTISTWTLEQWIEEYNRLKALNDQMLKTGKPSGASRTRSPSRPADFTRFGAHPVLSLHCFKVVSQVA